MDHIIGLVMSDMLSFLLGFFFLVVCFLLLLAVIYGASKHYNSALGYRFDKAIEETEETDGR